MKRKEFRNVAFGLFLGALFFTPISAYISTPLLVFSLVLLIISGMKFSFNKLDFLQFILLFSVILASIFAVDRVHSFYAGSAFIVYIIAYFTSKNFLNNDRNIKKVVDTISILIITVSIIGIIQYFTNFSLVVKDIPVIAPVSGNNRVTSICYNTLILASLLGFCIPVVISFFIEGKSRIFYGTAIFLGIITFFLTQSRGPTVAFIGAIFLLFILKRKWVFATLIPVILIIIVVMIEPLRVRFIHTFQSANDMARIVSFHAGIRMWKDNSIFTGVGIHNFYLLFEKYSLPGHRTGPHYIHNMYLNFLVDAGIIGFLSLLAVFGFNVDYSRRIYHKLKKNSNLRYFNLAIFSSLSGMLIHNFVDNTIYVMGLGILFWMGMGAVSSGQDMVSGLDI